MQDCFYIKNPDYVIYELIVMASGCFLIPVTLESFKQAAAFKLCDYQSSGLFKELTQAMLKDDSAISHSLRTRACHPEGYRSLYGGMYGVAASALKPDLQ